MQAGTAREGVLRLRLGLCARARLSAFAKSTLLDLDAAVPRGRGSVRAANYRDGDRA